MSAPVAPDCGRTRSRHAFPWRSGITQPAGSPASGSRSQVQQVTSSKGLYRRLHKGLHHGPIAIPIVARCRAKVAIVFLKDIALRRNRHRHADLDRQHGEGHDQAHRQRPNRERSCDGIGQSGRGNWRGAAVKACCARRPCHGRDPSMRGRITRNTVKYRGDRRQYWGGWSLENGEITAIREVMPAISAVQSVFGESLPRT
jgi:hypothetical protein